MTTRRPDLTTDARATVLTIDGMTCGSCVRHIQRAITSVQGVQAVEVTFSRRQARVVHEPAVNAEDLIAAIADAGYRASALAS